MKPIIIANWKMNPKSEAEALKIFEAVKKGMGNFKNVEVVICSPFLWLPGIIKSALPKDNIAFGAENCFFEKEGAFTGEIAAPMVKTVGCQYVILGHSERRNYFKETDEMINKKIRAALSENLKAIFCIGETTEEKREGKTDLVLENQIKEGLSGLLQEQIKNIVIAYEPVWAIGTGVACRPEEAEKAALYIKKTLGEIFGLSEKEDIPVLYGGSVKSANVADFIFKAKMDGVLVGGASLDPEEFLKIVEKAAGN